MKLTVKQFVFIFFLFFANNAWSQKVEVINGTGKKLKEGKSFVYISPITDTTGYEYVATLKAYYNLSRNYISDLFYVTRSWAQHIGANCFRYKSFSCNDSTRIVVLEVDCYVGNDDLFKANANNLEKNVVYIFGDQIKDSTDVYHAGFGSGKQDFTAGTYFKRTMTDGYGVYIDRVGLLRTHKIKKDEPAVFLTFAGFRISHTSGGMSFGSGGYEGINPSLGYLLSVLLDESK